MIIDVKDSVSKFGAMDQSTKASGLVTWQMAKDASQTPAGMFTKDSGLTVSQMATEDTFTIRDLLLKANGNRINSVDTELKLGQMAQNTKDNMQIA